MSRVLAVMILLLVATGCGVMGAPSDENLQAYAWDQGFSKDGSRLQEGGGRLHLKLNDKCDAELFYYWTDILFSSHGEYRLEVKRQGEVIDTITQKDIPEFVVNLRSRNVSEKVKGACLGS